MSNILSNIAALKSLYHLSRNEENYAQSVERISSGKRINAAGDDAAGASIVNRMTSQISGMKIAMRNAGDAISMAQTAEGAMNECSAILHRMRELAVQSANGTYSGADRVALNAEVVELKNELLRISETTKFNDVKLINGSFTDTTFEIGYDESPGHSHTLSIESVKPTDLGMWKTTTQLSKTATVASAANMGAAAVITTSDDHLFKVGDIVTYESLTDPSTATMPGLQSGHSYLVDAANFTTTTFSLTDLDGSAITYGQASAVASLGTGVGAKFHLASLAGSPSVSETGSADVGSKVIATEDITVHGHVGSTKVNIAAESNAKTIAEAISVKESLTGVKATAQTNARLTVTADDCVNDYKTVSFEIKGMNETAKIVSASIKMGTGDGLKTADLSDLRDKINGFSGSTGIQASLAADKSYIDLKSADGYDISISNVDFPATVTANRKTVSVAAGAAATSDTITSAGHGLVDGDQVFIRSINAHGETMAGLGTGVTYTVRDAATNTFKLTTGAVTTAAIDITAANAGTVVFEKVENSINFQTKDRNSTLHGAPVKLVDKELLAENGPVAVDSVRITGEVQYESSHVFTLVPDVKDTLFRDAPPAATLMKVSDMNVLTVDNSHSMLTSIDGALKRVDAERGDLGATMNRMGHTISNLGGIVVNSSAARSRIEDADMALETTELAKSQILTQAATAMVGQANKAMQTVLSLLR